jgi:hypothetical protein
MPKYSKKLNWQAKSSRQGKRNWTIYTILANTCIKERRIYKAKQSIFKNESMKHSF